MSFYPPLFPGAADPLREAVGGRLTAPLLGIGGGATPVVFATGIALAAVGTFAFGAVLGPEAPLIALGSAVGVSFTRFIDAGDREKAVLATAGSFSAISR